MAIPAASARLIWALGISQIAGYGTLYYSFSVLAPALARDFGWSPEMLYGALTIALLVGGLLAPTAGRWADRFGAGRMMAIGSILAALSLIAAAMAPNGPLFAVTLVAVELASAFVFYSTAFVAIVQAGGRNAQRSITHLTLIAGFSSTLYWPLTDLLQHMVGWRDVYLIFAAMNLVICLPIHAWIASLRRHDRQAVAPELAAALDPEPVAPMRRTLLGFMLAGFLVQGLLLSAVLVHMAPMLGRLGLASSGIYVTTLFGPAQVLSRFVNMVFGGKLRQSTLALLGATLMPAALAVLLLTAPSVLGALAFAVLFGLGSGLTSIVGGTLPLELFGRAGYGARLGWISSARLFASALAPSALALLFVGLGTAVALWTIASVGILGVAAFFVVQRLSSPSPNPASPVQPAVSG
ncbi:MAG: transporter [Hyphomicrobiales bacterium]|nr:transporter [Hyphomicrobiales bacterium]